MESTEGGSRRGIAQAVLAAALFGASTPCAKLLLGNVTPVLLAGLLYAGSGFGLGTWLLLRRLRGQPLGEGRFAPGDWRWLAGAIAFGGVLGPLLLMLGLARTPASSASLLLNLESALTAAIAWVAFRENVDRRIALGMLAIVAGGCVLSWGGRLDAVPWGALGIAGACLCWAIDNNLTRVVSGADPVRIAALKGGVAGCINLAIALASGARWPGAATVAVAALVGLLGYGISLVLFVRALRDLGTARTGAWFATAPFVGAALALALLRESPGVAFWIAGVLMALGAWLHASERHAHEHLHEGMEHDHRHVHDEHHRHAHDFPWDGSEPHAHPHVHEPMRHSHAHYPDLHHRHRH